jgi:hypothetical protein
VGANTQLQSGKAGQYWSLRDCHKKDGDWLVLNASSPFKGMAMIPNEKILVIWVPQ